MSYGPDRGRTLQARRLLRRQNLEALESGQRPSVSSATDEVELRIILLTRCKLWSTIPPDRRR